jgi:hypothetical protein
MAAVQAVSMVGGTIRRKLIYSGSFRASVLQHSDARAVENDPRFQQLLRRANLPS